MPTKINTQGLRSITEKFRLLGYEEGYKPFIKEITAGKQWKYTIEFSTVEDEIIFDKIAALKLRALKSFLNDCNKVVSENRLIRDRVVKSKYQIQCLRVQFSGLREINITKNKIAYQIGAGSGKSNRAKCAVLYI